MATVKALLEVAEAELRWSQRFFDVVAWSYKYYRGLKIRPD